MIDLDTILDRVCAHFVIERSRVMSAQRDQHTVMVRNIAMYFARNLATEGYQKLGVFFGRDHSSVIYAVKSVKHQLAERPAFKNVLKEIEDKILSGPQPESAFMPCSHCKGTGVEPADSFDEVPG